MSDKPDAITRKTLIALLNEDLAREFRRDRLRRLFADAQGPAVHVHCEGT